MESAEEKYREAIELYRSSELTLSEISRRCGVSRTALAAYIQRNHRDLMFRRHGAEPDADTTGPMRRNTGQSAETRRKYREAILACDSERYIQNNVSEVAAIFGVNPTSLGNQLRMHYPEILERREAERRRLGIADNLLRGPRQTSVRMYAEAVEMLRTQDISIRDAAKACDVSFTGLRQHVQFYHKDLMEIRSGRRRDGKETPKVGHLAGNGQLRLPDEERRERFRKSVEMFRDTSMTIAEIAEATGVEKTQLRQHLRMWHRSLIVERYGVDPASLPTDRENLSGFKRYSKGTREKYAEAIALLLDSGMSTEAVAKKYGFAPEAFRSYLREHEPDLYDKMGMMTLPNGRRVWRRSYERYKEAIEIYQTTHEPLKAIARRLNLNYNSLRGFIRRAGINLELRIEN